MGEESSPSHLYKRYLDKKWRECGLPTVSVDLQRFETNSFFLNVTQLKEDLLVSTCSV